jgi:REP element-mobilizing transposase RayT
MLPTEKYHVFNHANGRENIFIEEKNYTFFLEKLRLYVLPVCKLFSYCLMPNHFHLVLEVRSEEELSLCWQKPGTTGRFSEEELTLKISRSFGNLFSSYTQAFNKVYDRKGSLFIPSMKSEQISDENSFCKVVHYTHANPVHHGFTRKMNEWPHSSYHAYLSEGATKLEREYVLDIFGGKNAFLEYHEQPIDLKYKFIE